MSGSDGTNMLSVTTLTEASKIRIRSAGFFAAISDTQRAFGSTGTERKRRMASQIAPRAKPKTTLITYGLAAAASLARSGERGVARGDREARPRRGHLADAPPDRYAPEATKEAENVAFQTIFFATLVLAAVRCAADATRARIAHEPHTAYTPRARRSRPPGVVADAGGATMRLCRPGHWHLHWRLYWRAQHYPEAPPLFSRYGEFFAHPLADHT